MLTVCLGGMYGSNCRVTCGNCFESKQCHYINGTCMNGCGRGYQGVHCTEVNRNNLITCWFDLMKPVKLFSQDTPLPFG
uniref:Uncharacterized protein n=1 Tax=Magallana gigas TaxID=29159 RepID=K1PTI8_MAGGI